MEASLTSRLRTRCLAPSSAGWLCKRISGWESTISNDSFLTSGRREALIQLLVAAALPEEVIKGRPQRIRLCRTGMVSVGQEVSVELPEILGELLQEVAMGQEAWRQFLVVALFMNPAQGQLDGQPVALGRIITEQQLNHRVGGLGSVGRDRQGFLHALAQIGSLFG